MTLDWLPRPTSLAINNIQFGCERDDIFPLERDRPLPRSILGVENRLNDRDIAIPGRNSVPLSVSGPAIRAERLLPEAAHRSLLTAGSETDQGR